MKRWIILFLRCGVIYHLFVVSLVATPAAADGEPPTATTTAATVSTPTDGNKDLSNLRGGVASDESSQQQRREQEESQDRHFAFFSSVVDLIRGWFHHPKPPSPSLPDTGSSSDVQSSDFSGQTAHPSTFYPTSGSTSNPLAVKLEPQELKDAGKIATIVGGNDADPSEAPFFAMMLTYDVESKQWEYNGCGGTLVSDRHVLTAGHCAYGRNKDLDAVYVHAYQPFFGNPGVNFHYSKVLSYTVHPSFDDGPNDSDVAIVTMTDPLDISTFPPIKLAPPTLVLSDGDIVIIYGFGRTSYSDDSQVNTLQSVSIPFISRSTCQKFYGSKILDDMVCAGDVGGGKDACGGDSGGPMIVYNGNQVYQAAIVSWGDGCAATGKPGVYSSIPYHFNWIRSTVCSVSDVKTPSNGLCNNQQGYSSMSNPTEAHASASETSSNQCKNKKKIGASCFFGGDCCSGTCSVVSGKWVCAADEAQTRSRTAPTAPTAASRKPVQLPTRKPTNNPTESPTWANESDRDKYAKKGGKMGKWRRRM